MKKFLIIGMLAAALSACSDSDGAERALRNLGFTEIETFGWTMWGCGDEDMFKTKFRAKSPTGETVGGAVCSGWFKGSTVRTF